MLSRLRVTLRLVSHISDIYKTVLLSVATIAEGGSHKQSLGSGDPSDMVQPYSRTTSGGLAERCPEMVVGSRAFPWLPIAECWLQETNEGAGTNQHNQGRGVNSSPLFLAPAQRLRFWQIHEIGDAGHHPSWPTRLTNHGLQEGSSTNVRAGVHGATDTRKAPNASCSPAWKRRPSRRLRWLG